MIPPDEHPPQRRQNQRRREDEIRQWLPLILSLVTSLILVVMAWGRVSARLDLIEYRLQQIEQSLKGKVILP